MAKMKTHSSSKKRFKKTASGLFKRSRAYRRHHGWAKANGKMRTLRGISYVHKTNQEALEKLMPYA